MDSAQRITLLECFHRMQDAIEDLADAIEADNERAAWLASTPAPLAARRRTAVLLRDIWHREGAGDPRQTLNDIGLIGCDPHTRTLAARCNEAKDAFKAAVQALKVQPTRRQRLLAEMAREAHVRDRDVARALAAGGIGRLHLLQAYRHVPLLAETPARVGFSWASGSRSIRSLSRDEALALVEAMPDTHPAKAPYRQLLLAQPEHERVAQMRVLAPNLVANLVFVDGHETVERTRGGRTAPARREIVRRQLIHVHLPILFPLAPGETLPRHPLAAPEPRAGGRLARADRQIEDEPLLPALRIYRYRPLA